MLRPSYSLSLGAAPWDMGQVLRGLILPQGRAAASAALDSPYRGGELRPTRWRKDPQGGPPTSGSILLSPFLSPSRAPPPIPPALGILLPDQQRPRRAIKPCSERPPRRCIAPGRHRHYIGSEKDLPVDASRTGEAPPLGSNKDRVHTYIWSYVLT